MLVYIEHVSARMIVFCEVRLHFQNVLSEAVTAVTTSNTAFSHVTPCTFRSRNRASCGYMLGILFSLEAGNSTLFRNVGEQSPDCMTSRSEGQYIEFVMWLRFRIRASWSPVPRRQAGYRLCLESIRAEYLLRPSLLVSFVLCMHGTCFFIWREADSGYLRK
jgi:hypothetical protein